MAKKPKDDREHFRPLGSGVAVEVLKSAAPAIIHADVDPVILELRASLGLYRASLKLTKKPENPLSRG